MRVAAVQMDVSLAALAENIQRVAGRLADAAANGAELVVFPECVLCGYCFESRQEAAEVAIGLDDPAWQPLRDALAAHPGVSVSLGFLEAAEAGQMFNSSVLWSGGKPVGLYRKIHLPQLGVDRFVDRGDRPYRTWPAGAANVGMAICYDSSFPEPMRVLGLAGADVIALSTNWPVAALRTALLVPPARSMENHLYFVAANRVGQERSFQFCGRSSICGPDGIELARADDDSEQILYADIDLEAARNKRIERTVGTHVIDRFADRRPEFYEAIVQPVQPVQPDGGAR